MSASILIVIRSAITVVLFAAFIGLWAWAWSRRRKDDFAAAARLPLQDEPLATGSEDRC